MVDMKKLCYNNVCNCVINAAQCQIDPPASKASREIENFDWKKIHMPPYMVSKNLSVCHEIQSQQDLQISPYNEETLL